MKAIIGRNVMSGSRFIGAAFALLGLAPVWAQDALPSISIGDVGMPEGNAGVHGLVFPLHLSVTSPHPVSVSFAMGGGTATPGADYFARTGTVWFGTGTLGRIEVGIVGDTQFETNEYFVVRLSEPKGAVLAKGEALGRINNDDYPPPTNPPPPVVSIRDVALPEGHSGTRGFHFELVLNHVPTGDVTVAFATANGSAFAGSDYISRTGTVSFGTNKVKHIEVPVLGDTMLEPNENFFVRLLGVHGAILARSFGVGTILNDDTAPTNRPPVLVINDVSHPEGASGTHPFVFEVWLKGTPTSAVTVAFATTNGSAVAGEDYEARHGVLEFGTNRVRRIEIPVFGDTQWEANERFLVRLREAVGALVADGEGVGTIVNDDFLQHPTNAVPLRLFPGRNLVGGAGWPVAVSNIIDPKSIIEPPVIGWNPVTQQYITNVVHIEPLHGYWIHAITSGVIYLPQLPPPPDVALP